MRQPHRAEHVDVELTTGFLQWHVLDRSIRAVTGIVDQHVEASRLVDDPGDAGPHLVVVGDVHHQRTDSGRGQGFEPVEAAGGAVDDDAGCRQGAGGCLTDPEDAPVTRAILVLMGSPTTNMNDDSQLS